MSSTNSTQASGLAPQIQNLIMTILEQLGVTGVTLADPEFRLVLQSPDGQNLFAQLMQMSGKASLGANPVVLETSGLQGEGGGTTLGNTQPIIPATSLASGGVQATLTAGEVTGVLLNNKAGDLLVARLVTSGGTPGAAYSVQSTSSTQVTIISQTAAGAKQTADTSTVEVYNFGNPAN